ncbi:MAG: hypothetical protein HY685_00655 [Chloroflexi bacterium]|nr:hypothetical protein [Chloroflexota bacterium]
MNSPRFGTLTTKVFLLAFGLYVAFAVGSIAIGFADITQAVSSPPSPPPHVEQPSAIGPSSPSGPATDVWSRLRDLIASVPLPRLPGHEPPPGGATVEQDAPAIARPSPLFILGSLVTTLLPALLNLVFGMLLVWRRPGNWLARLLALGMVGTAASFFYPAHGSLVRASSYLLAIHLGIHAVSGAAYVHGLLLLPDGRLSSRWWAWFIGTVYLLAGAFTLLALPYALTPAWETMSPVHMQAVGFLERAVFIIFFGLLIPVTGIVSQVHRYRQIRLPDERQRVKFVVWGLSLAFGLGLLLVSTGAVLFVAQLGGLTGEMLERLNASVLYAFPPLFGAIPVVLFIAMLRHRLFNMDVVIKRTLVYVPLTGIVAGMYIASAGVLSRSIAALTGQRSEITIGLATLIVVALLTPARNWLQVMVDKRFKESPDPAKRLFAFRDHVRSVLQVTDKQALSDRLLQEATTAFGATGGAVYLRERDGKTVVRIAGDWINQPRLALPLVSNGHELGSLCLGDRRDGQGYTEQDKELLKTILGDVADAMHTASTGEREAS